MANMFRFPDLALGDLEREVLDVLWRDGALNPGAVHERVGASRGISVSTVSSALTRLQQKGLLTREKVSHAYVYRPIISRAELQRNLIREVASHFGEGGGVGFLAAFVDFAEEGGEDTLRRLEQLVARRLEGNEP